MKTLFWTLTTLGFLLSACVAPSSKTAPAPQGADSQSSTDAPSPNLPDAAPRPGQSLSAMPEKPLRIEFQAEDGPVLVGYYYPAAFAPAPLIVLMHWPGDGVQSDWFNVGMAPWLQNRGLDVPVSPKGSSFAKRFDTPYPFPALPEPESYAVFTFDFRGFGESGGPPLNPTQWEQYILDARAAYATAAALEGVDPARIVGIGAGIGADAAVNACGEGCLGALSIGPGEYLGKSYVATVQDLDRLGKPAWCVAAQDASLDASVCSNASGQFYRPQIYPAGGHAMMLFRAELNLEPPIESVILDFLRQTLGKQ